MKPNAGKTIAISLGGYSRTYRWLTTKTDAEMARNHLLLSGDHVVRVVGESELDGSPTIISCRYSCVATLTLTPDFAGAPSSVSGHPGYGPDGTALRISFAPDLFPRWKEIRHNALCFAATVIPNSGTSRPSKPKRRSCAALRKAITSAMHK
jgi:hypothetical protein